MNEYDQWTKKYPHLTKKTKEHLLPPDVSKQSAKQTIEQVQHRIEQRMKSGQGDKKRDDQFLRALEKEKRFIRYST